MQGNSTLPSSLFFDGLTHGCKYGLFQPYPSRDVNVLNPCFISVIQSVLTSVFILTGAHELWKLYNIKIVPPQFKYQNSKLRSITPKHLTQLSNVAFFIILQLLQYSLFKDEIRNITKLSVFLNLLYLIFLNAPQQLFQFFKTSAASTTSLFYYLTSSFIYGFVIGQRYFHPTEQKYNILPLNSEAAILEIVIFIISLSNFIYEVALYEPSTVLTEYFKEVNYYPPVNFFESITFTWMNKFVSDVYKAGKVEDPYNMPLPPCNLSVKDCNDKLSAAWEQQRWNASMSSSSSAVQSSSVFSIFSKNKKNVKTVKPSLLKAILKVFGKTIFVAMCYETTNDIIRAVQPRFLQQFIKTFETSDSQSQYPVLNAFFIAILLFLIVVVETVLTNQFFIIIFEAGLGIRSALMTMLYQKSLKLSVASKERKTTGDILNLISVDVLKLQRFFEDCQSIVGVPISFIIVLLSLYNLMGYAMVGGIVAMAIMIPINSYISTNVSGLFKKNMQYKDMRSKLITEILNSIKSIKLYAWEKPMLSKLSHVRNDLEMRNYKILSIYNCLIMFCWNLVPVFVSSSSFALYSHFNEKPLTADIIFPALTLFDLLNDTIYYLPNIISQVIETRVSLNRLQDFLDYEETDDSFIFHEDQPKDGASALPTVEIKNATFLWKSEASIKAEAETQNEQNKSDEEEQASSLKYALKNIDDFKADDGQLTCIVGRVGTGKSTFLQALLGSLPAIAADPLKSGPKLIYRGKSIAYCPQQAWITNSTFKENIVFGYRYDEQIYQATLKACQLLPDLKILPDGDATVVGEKGISLSGGQKARLALARAVYSRADIYLLDDVLSAVDAEVSKNIIEQVLSRETGLLKNKTIILTTNSVKVLKHSGSVYALQDCQIVEHSSYKDIMQKQDGSLLKKLVEEFDTFESVQNRQVKEEETLEQKEQRVEIIEQKMDVNHSQEDEDDDIAQNPDDFNPLEIVKSGGAPGNNNPMIETRSLLSRRASAATFRPNRLLVEQENDNRKTKQKAENKEEGRVQTRVYVEYAKACGLLGVFLFFFFMFSSNGFELLEKYWLKLWSEVSERVDTDVDHTLLFYVGIYFTISCGASFFAVLRAIFMNLFCSLRASRLLHDRMASSVIRAPMQFFETTPIGRVTNRFTSDVSAVDQGLQFMLNFFFKSVLNYLTTVVVISYVMPWFLVLNTFLLIIYYYYQTYYVTLSRDLKRLTSVSFSPIMSGLSETLVGSTVINAFQHFDRFNFINFESVQFNINCVFNVRSTNRWLSVRLQIIGGLIILFTSVAACASINTSHPISAGLIGLLMAYAMQVSTSLLWIVRMAVQIETNIVSVERILEYCDLKSEKPLIIDEHRVPENWPSEGKIEFKDYTTSYRADLDPSLKKVSVEIKPREKVGIVGRTGAGKSTLTLALFRLLEAMEGKILIDGIDISEIGLTDLRSHLSIIPQDAQAFEGTIRYNVDPFNQYSDEEVMKALELSHLKPHIESMCKAELETSEESQKPNADPQPINKISTDILLKCKVADNGSNLSVGQRQLLCLSRALLNQSKILVLDEATAAVDMETDKIIQETIRSKFNERTILTIAHRIDTVLDSDKILVLDKGEIKEFDHPDKLLEDKSTIFYSLCEKGGYLNK
ncbi:Bile pigment transporter 1 [Hanseniaspora osmophila]|uniref:Bile pigment transporter 1 n=1 Tax=Hanseniaspora osmophila TaxID=56408 RepID=A0A1E5RND7_9ASCO|nr:Bile pigment transporter 1 [Hanseniaspora osmophila]